MPHPARQCRAPDLCPAFRAASSADRMRPVIIAENIGVFQKFARGNAPFELGTINEIIGLAVDFVAPRLPASCRKPRTSALPPHSAGGHQGGFSRARRRGNNENSASFDVQRLFPDAVDFGLRRQPEVGQRQALSRPDRRFSKGSCSFRDSFPAAENPASCPFRLRPRSGAPV